MKNCPSCRSLNNNDAAFCLHCGTNLNQTELNVSKQEQTIVNNKQNEKDLNNFNPDIKNDNSGNKKINIKLIIIMFITIIILAITIIICAKKDNIEKESSNKVINIKEEVSFFLENSDGLYAVFNEAGQQITEFLYSEVYDEVFESSTLVVLDENEEKKVIDRQGREIINIPKDYEIEKYGQLYYLFNKNEEYGDLYNLDGKKVLENIPRPISTYGQSIKTTIYLEENELVLLNADGKETIRIKDDFSDIGNLYLNSYFDLDKDIDSDYLNIERNIYDQDIKIHYIYDEKNEKLIYKIVIPANYYLINHNSDYSSIVFEDQENYKYFKNGQEFMSGKIYDEYNNCDLRIYNDKLVCETYEGSYLINSDGTLNNESLKQDLHVINEDSYGFYLQETNTYYIYHNDELVNSFEGYNLINGGLEDIYELSCHDCDKDDIIVNQQGEVIKNTGYYGFIKYNNYYIVNSPRKQRDEIFDLEWNKIELPLINGNEIQEIIYYSDEYIIGTIDNEVEFYHFVFDKKKNKVIIKNNDELAGVSFHLADNWTLYSCDAFQEDKVTIYNIELNKKLGTYEDVYYYENYFTVEDEKNTYYYSYITGEKFLTLKNN